ncbi:hypothetical protein N7501_009261 [Penicillium viridicatum]|nr:hypothetical protein N7501_009261 [Penicillium viridicatum]
MGSHETRAGSAIARATDGYLGLATENRRHATATITVVNGTFLNRHNVICYPVDLSLGQSLLHNQCVLHQHLVLLATTDKLHMTGRVFDFFGKI